MGSLPGKGSKETTSISCHYRLIPQNQYHPAQGTGVSSNLPALLPLPSIQINGMEAGLAVGHPTVQLMVAMLLLLWYEVCPPQAEAMAFQKGWSGFLLVGIHHVLTGDS